MGVPDGVEWDVDEVRRRHDEEMLKLELPGVARMTAEDLALLRRCSMLRYRNGLQEIPVWLQANGGYRWTRSIDGMNYARLLVTFHELLVSLNGTTEKPAPIRYIELKPEAETGQRRFVEVEMIMERDNTVRVEIIGMRVEGKDVHASHAMA